MGRKKIQIEYIQDEKVRFVTFKKRRLGLLRKAMQLSELTSAKIELKVYQPEDQSLVQYFSHGDRGFKDLNKESENVVEFASFY